MVIKAVTFFLIGMVVLAMFGRLRAPKIKNPLSGLSDHKTRKCKACGSYIIGKGPCSCGKDKS